MARMKSEARRRNILDVVAQVFVEHGFERTSMSMIAERLGGSKATLYNYFKSKEELFLAVLDFEIDTNAEAILGVALGEPDTHAALTKIGCGYLMQRLSVRPTRFFRMVSGQAEESDIGDHFWNTILKPAWMLLCNKLQELMDEGRLRQADPWQATVHFKGLMDTDIVERRLLGVISKPDPDLCWEVASKGVTVFLSAYGPDNGRAKAKAGRRPAAS
jgi:AcrR family transcriptional regulator